MCLENKNTKTKPDTGGFAAGQKWRGTKGHIWEVIAVKNGYPLTRQFTRPAGEYDYGGTEVSDLDREGRWAGNPEDSASLISPVEQAEAPLEIAVGKRYRARGGKVFAITGTNGGSLFAGDAPSVDGSDTNRLFHRDGRHFYSKGELDLVALAEAEVPPVVVGVGTAATGGDRGAFWMVWRDGGESPKQKHASEEKVKAEARRLGYLFPTATFHVLMATGAVVPVKSDTVDMSGQAVGTVLRTRGGWLVHYLGDRRDYEDLEQRGAEAHLSCRVRRVDSPTAGVESWIRKDGKANRGGGAGLGDVVAVVSKA